MLILTKALKGWLEENVEGVDDTATDDELKQAVGSALATGKLSVEKLTELTKPDEAGEANEFLSKLDKLIEAVGAKGGDGADTGTKDGEKPGATMPCPKCGGKMSAAGDHAYKCTKCGYSMEGKEAPKGGKPDGTKQPSRFAKMVSELGGLPVEPEGERTVEVRVKEAAEQYDDTKTAAIFPESTKGGRPHPLAGQRMKDCGRSLHEPTDRDMALAGAFAKFQIACVTPRIAGSAQRAWEVLPQHDKELLCYLTEKGDWCADKDGKVGSTKGYLSPNGSGRRGIKAIIDDATSGGLEAAPIVFDDLVIQTPLLHGELFPLVNTIPLDRGRRVEGVETGTVTGNWGGVDDTAVSLFNTNSYVSAFDTTVFRWEGAIQIGLDFLSDTPIDFGAHVTTQYGERLLEDLDDVIAAGDGTTQPEGVINKTGTTSVAFGGATSIGNYESLRFGVQKREHRANVKASAVFCGTETSYQRVMALPVGAADARRLFGAGQKGGTNSYDDYSIMSRPYKINESLTNAQIFYAILARYRMYRRRGLVIRTSTEGDTLIRNNAMLIVAMARYGGQLERGAVAAVTTTAPA